MLTTKTASRLHQILTTTIAEIRDAYNTANIANIRIDIEISGRSAGDLSLQYKFSDSYNGGDSTSSHNIHQALVEFLRRRGWSEQNQAALLTYCGEEKIETTEESDIPF